MGFYTKVDTKYPTRIKPRIIRYIPKTEKSCFFTKSIRNFIVTSDMTKETAIPIRRIPTSAPVTVAPDRANLATFKSDAPSITGIAIKKENSAPAPRDTPRTIEPSIVEPERDVPGIRDRT